MQTTNKEEDYTPVLVIPETNDIEPNPFEKAFLPARKSQKDLPDLHKVKLTNRKLREQALLDLVRKTRPLVAKSIRAAVKILDNEESSDQNKLKAAALILNMHRSLILDLYDRHYDDEENQEIQPNEPKTVFSLKVIGQDDAEDAD